MQKGNCKSMLFFLLQKIIKIVCTPLQEYQQKNICQVALVALKHFTFFLVSFVFVNLEKYLTMIKSMTGYGKAICELPDKKITIEIRTLNSKQLDLNSRIPSVYKEKELEMRSLISKGLDRGKIDLSFWIEDTGAETNYTFNNELIKNYYVELKKITQVLNIKEATDLLSITMRLPDVLKNEREELDEEEWAKIKQCLMEVIEKVNEYRIAEGKVLEADFDKRVKLISELQSQLSPHEKERIERLRSRLNNELNKQFDNDDIDKNRLEQELLYYLEKFDITEEKVRLANHCSYFSETIACDASGGKKLGFIAQEMGREINTIGSKANHSEIQKIVVQMKDELEKIKEQLMNIL